MLTEACNLKLIHIPKKKIARAQYSYPYFLNECFFQFPSCANNSFSRISLIFHGTSRIVPNLAGGYFDTSYRNSEK